MLFDGDGNEAVAADDDDRLGLGNLATPPLGAPLDTEGGMADCSFGFGFFATALADGGRFLDLLIFPFAAVTDLFASFSLLSALLCDDFAAL